MNIEINEELGWTVVVTAIVIAVQSLTGRSRDSSGTRKIGNGEREMENVRLELRAMWWLRFEKRCPLAFFQRGPMRAYGSKPDVLGITESRHLIEVEVKRSLSDFKADAKKPHIQNRDMILTRWPRYFYYLVDPLIEWKCEIPTWAGLLTVKDYHVQVMRKAPANELSPKLGVKECIGLFRILGNQVWSSESAADNMRRAFREGSSEWGVEYHI